MKNKIYLFFLGIFILGCHPEDSGIRSLIKIDSGLIEGSEHDDLKKFLGIPYAEPPIGKLRWAPTLPVKPWDGIKSTRTNSKICYQPKQTTEFYDRGPEIDDMSEDCLTLNVWTRAKNSNEKLPVMVWFHGGALVWGSGSEYSGEELTQYGVILVTVNYRLGPFGFFSHPDLSQEYGSSGNQGFRDQIESLKWVKKNIRNFGGDPDNVTIFGESAGSWSVNVLQATPLAKGLFHKVIGQSGARLLPLTHLEKSSPYSLSAENLGMKLSQIMSEGKSTSLENLKSLSPAAIIKNVEKDPMYSSQFDALTVIDGDVIPEDISMIFKKGEQADVPVLLGSTADEATTFDPKIINPGIEMISYKDLTISSIKGMLPMAGDDLSNLYPVTSEEEAKRSWENFTTDVMFTAQMQKWANLMSTVESPAYLYLWDWYPIIDGSTKYRAFHGAEVPYVFGTLDRFDIDARDKDIEFSEKMMKIWTNFAKTGNPSFEDFLWPEFNSKTNEYVILGDEISVERELRLEKVKLINEAYDSARVDFN